MEERLEDLSRVDPRDNPERLVDAMESKPPKRPFSWDKSEPKALPKHMAAEPMFMVIAKAVRAAGKGYLLDHLWTCYDYGKNVLGPWRQHKHELEQREARERRQAEMDGEL